MKLNMRKPHTTVLVTALFLMTAGCSILKVPGKPPELYNLTPKSTYIKGLPQTDKQLIIEEPIAAGGLDTNRIALRPKATRLQFFADARWTERAPKMVQTLLIESFENTGKIIAVGRQSIGLRSDYTLKTELREFQAEKRDDEKYSVHVRINVKVVKQPQKTIVGSRSFERSVLANNGDGLDGIISAFDKAAGKVIKELVEWTLITMK